MKTIIVNEIDISFLEDFALQYLNKYNNLRDKLSKNNMKKIKFGSEFYKIQIQYGINHGLGIHYYPNRNLNQNVIEYLITDELNLLIQNRKTNVIGTGSVRIRYPDSSELIYFNLNNKTELTKDFAEKKAIEYFDSDCKEFNVKIKGI